MATKAATATKRKAKTKQPKVTYLSTVMFPADEVRGKKLEQDNVEYLSPLCIDSVQDGDLVAVYEFTGLKRITKTVGFTDAK